MSNTYFPNIFEYIRSQETMYEKPIQLTGGWKWGMKDHIETSFLYTFSQLKTGKDDFKPVKNITRPITNLAKRAEGFDVKDIVLYVNEPNKEHLSFLIKKLHEKWALENAIDTFIDELVSSYVDYGGVLVKNVNDVKPEVVPLQSIVFCDQTDILSGPIGIKHYYSPDQLLEMEQYGWGDKKKGATATLEEAIILSREIKREEVNGVITDTPGKYIEVYEVHGNMPKRFRTGEVTEKYETQLFIGCFYQKKDGTKGNITLYHMPETKSPFKFLARDAVYGRALGFGGAEELFEAQVWTNYDMIRMQGMLDAASKTILKATGANSAAVAQKNKVRDMDNLQIVDVGPDGDLNQVDTFPRNLALFEKSAQEWENHARSMGAAQEAISGDQPPAGTPFKSVELQATESHSLHEYRKGQIATFVEQIYREWIIPHFGKELRKDQKFFAELDLDELRFVVERTVANAAHQQETEIVLSGGDIDPEATNQLKEQVKEQIKKKGSQHFIELFKGEVEYGLVCIRVNVAGKQKNLGQMVDKLTNIFRQAFANPMGFAQTMQISGMAKTFNEIIEYSGLSPVDFSDIDKSVEKMQAAAQPPTPTVPPTVPPAQPMMAA